jgi:hypothetical protein
MKCSQGPTSFRETSYRPTRSLCDRYKRRRTKRADGNLCTSFFQLPPILGCRLSYLGIRHVVEWVVVLKVMSALSQKLTLEVEV